MTELRLLGLHRPRPISFVYAPEWATSGTTVMRGRQLSEIASASRLGRRRAVSFVPMDVEPRRADLFLTKGVLKDATPARLASWRSAGNRLFADPVDEDLSDELAHAVDVVVAASLVAAAEYRCRWPDRRVVVVNHHVDPRTLSAVAGGSTAPQHRAHIGYFGEIGNTVTTPAIERIVDFVGVATDRQDVDWFARLPDYNAHYAVRRRQYFDRNKPFLKGFTAAACGAPIIIQDSEAEPRRWLPEGYPFWLRGEVTESTILAVLDDVAGAFGTPRWTEAREMMADIAQKTNPAAIVRELSDLFA